MPDTTSLIVFPGASHVAACPPPPASHEYVLWPEVEANPHLQERVTLAVLDQIGGQARRELMLSLPNLQAIQLSSIGYDYIENQVPPGIALHNAASAFEDATAESCLLGLLVLLRQYNTHQEANTRGSWVGAYPQRGLDWQTRIRGLSSKKVLLLGYGGVGQAIAQRLRGFDAEVMPFGRTARIVDGVAITPMSELDAWLPDADIVVLALPLNADSRQLVDAEFLAKMKTGAVLSNIGRGALVNTADLVDALNAHHIGAALDVVDPEPLPPGHPLWECPNLVLTPHAGGSSDLSAGRLAALIARQVGAFVAGDELLNRVR